MRTFLLILFLLAAALAQSPTPTHFVDNEIPAGAVNGTNGTYTLAHTPNPAGSLRVERNGLGQQAGGYDYTLAGAVFTFVSAAIPQSGDSITASYRY